MKVLSARRRHRLPNVVELIKRTAANSLCSNSIESNKFKLVKHSVKNVGETQQTISRNEQTLLEVADKEFVIRIRGVKRSRLVYRNTFENDTI